jgi:hypothetical protein
MAGLALVTALPSGGCDPGSAGGAAGSSASGGARPSVSARPTGGVSSSVYGGGTAGISVVNNPPRIELDEFGLVPVQALFPAGNLRNFICESLGTFPELEPAVLGVVLDVSSSMAVQPANAPAGEPNRWVLTKDALSAAIDSLPEAVAVGISF